LQAVRLGSNISPSSFEITPREMEVLTLLSEGKTNPKIAIELHITENTVKTHVRKIMEKLNAATRAEAVRIAIRKGLLKT